MNKVSTYLLKATVIIAGLLVLVFTTLFLPRAIISELASDFDYLPIMLLLLAASIPFLYAMWQTYKLLGYIDKNKVFSKLSVDALRSIKFCAATVSVLFAVAMPYIFHVAELDDAPGVAAIGFIIVGASLVIATAAGVFQRLLRNAVEIKSENDLTV